MSWLKVLILIGSVWALSAEASYLTERARFYSENIGGLRDESWVHSHALTFYHGLPRGADAEEDAGLRAFATFEYQDYWKQNDSARAVGGIGLEWRAPGAWNGLRGSVQRQVTRAIGGDAGEDRWKLGVVGNWYQSHPFVHTDEYFEVFRIDGSLYQGTGGLLMLRVYQRLNWEGSSWSLDPWACDVRTYRSSEDRIFGVDADLLSLGVRAQTQGFWGYLQASLFTGLRARSREDRFAAVNWGLIAIEVKY